MKVLEFAVLVVIVVVCNFVSPVANGCPESPISIENVSTDTVGVSLTSLTTIQIVALDTLSGVAAVIVPGEGYEVVSQPAKRAGLLLPGATGIFAGSLRLTRTGTTVVTIEGSGVGHDGRQIMSNYRLVVAISDTSAASYSISDYIALTGVSSQSLPTLGTETIIYASGTAMAEPLGADSTWSDDSANIAKGTFGVRGYLLYHDPVDSAGVLRPAVNVTVEIWDSDGSLFNGDDRLGATITDWNGYFEKSGLDNSDGLFGGSADPYLRYKTANSKWRVASTLTQEYYWWHSYRSFSNVGNGSTQDFGNDYIPEQSVAEGAMWIYQFVNLGWNAVASIDDDPGTVTVGWPKAEHGNYYDPSCDGIFIYQNDADAIDRVNHEYGHFLMNHARGHDNFNANCPSPHYIEDASNETCAWDEGWATFFTQVVRNDNTYDFEAYGDALDLEYTVYGWDGGPSCEGRVARALVDLWDINNDFDDQNSAYPVSFYDIYMRGLHSARDNTFRDFWDRTKGNIISYPEAYCGVRSIANNTIQFVGAMRGDCNADNAVDISDAIFILARIFSGGPPPIPYLLVGDVNCDKSLDISDVVYLISFIFSGGARPCPFQ